MPNDKTLKQVDSATKNTDNKMQQGASSTPFNLKLYTPDSKYDGLSPSQAYQKRKLEENAADLTKIAELQETVAPEERGDVVKNYFFSKEFKNSNDPDDKKIWDNRFNMTPDERQLAYANSLYKKDTVLDSAGYPVRQDDIEDRKDVARAIFRESAKDKTEEYNDMLDNLPDYQVDEMLKSFGEISNDLSVHYKEYNGTDKLNLSREDQKKLLSKFQAWADIAGNKFAAEELAGVYQDIAASNQSYWEKAANAGVQFVDDAAGFIIRAAGMITAATRIPALFISEDNEEARKAWGLDKSYLNSIIDNPITRYGDNVSELQAWSLERQEALEEAGLTDNPIMETREDQDAYLSWNTPFSLFGQYGFTVASTLVSMGGGAAIKGLIKVGAAAAKIATGANALNKTTTGIRIARAAIQSEKIGNFIVAASVGSIEGAQNAVNTRDDILDSYRSQFDAEKERYIEGKINDFCLDKNKVNDRFNLIVSKIADSDEEYAKELLKLTDAEKEEIVKNDLYNDQGFRSNALSEVAEEYEDKERAASLAADKAMYTDFIGNSIINGAIGVTLKATLQARGIQRSLRKLGLQKSALERKGVNIVKEDNVFKAIAKKYTKTEAIYDRLKESLGEGLEEYFQSLSSGFATGFAESDAEKYLRYKYGNNEGNKAFEYDIWESIAAGYNNMVDKATDKETIKEFIYGGLSTALGGFNANTINNVSKSAKLEGENRFSRFSRRSPIAWRSAFSPLFVNSEAVNINAKREEAAARYNEMFADKKVSDLFFTSSFAAQTDAELAQATDRGQEMEIRDAAFRKQVSSLYLLNTLEGTEYYNAVLASIQARANFNAENLANPESAESKAVDNFLNASVNRGQGITREEALEQIKKNASELLEMNQTIKEETKAVEKLFGADIDKDTKESFIFQNLSIRDKEKRMKALDDELLKVNDAIEKMDNKIEDSGLVGRAKNIVSRYGSLPKAREAAKEIAESIKELKESIKEFNKEIKVQEAGMYKANAAVKEINSKAIVQSRMAVKAMTEDLNRLEKDQRDLNKDIKSYERQVPEEETISTVNGNEVKQKVRVGTKTLSAREIMSLPAIERAVFINEYLEYTNKVNNGETVERPYSAEQMEEIAKLLDAGSKVYDDFSSKLLDRGRLQANSDHQAQLKLQLLSSPESFMAYQAGIKLKKQREMLDEKNSYLNNYTQSQYTEFAEELDKIMKSDDKENIASAIRVLKRSNNANYQKYISVNDRVRALHGALNSSKKYKELNGNDKNLISYTIDYLANRDIDEADNDAVVQALTEVNPETGKTLFQEYVESENSKVDKKDTDSITSFTSTGEVIQNFKDVVSDIRRDAEEKSSNAKEVAVEETTPENNEPSVIPVPKEPTPQPTPPSGGGAAAETATQSPQESKGDNVIETFRESSNDAVAKAAEVALNHAKNAPDTVSGETSRNIATNSISSLKDNFFETVEDFNTALLKEANELDGTGEKAKQNAARILRNAVAAIQLSQKKGNNSNNNESPLTGRAKTRFNITSNISERVLSRVDVNSSMIKTIDFAKLRKDHPESALVKFLDKYKVEEFLSDPSAVVAHNTTVKFMTNSAFTEDVKKSMKDAGRNYTVNDIPVFPVVEVEKNNGHCLVVKEGEKEHYYQPIGILPSTNNIYVNGANRLGVLRNFAQASSSNSIIKDGNGNEITTTLARPVHAKFESAKSNTPISAMTVAMNDYKGNDSATLRAASKKDRRKSKAYKDMKKKFISGLVVEDTGLGRAIYYVVDTLKGDGSKTRILVTTNSVGETYDKNSGNLIVDLFREGRVDEALESNSRIKRFAGTIHKFFKDDFNFKGLFITEANGTLSLSDTAQEDLDAMSEKLTGRLNNFFNLPSRLSGGQYTYKIKPSITVDADGVSHINKTADGRPLFSLYVENAESSIHLGDVTQGSMTPQTQFNIIKNLLLDADNKVRERQGGYSFVQWQVNYNDIANMKTDDRAMGNVSDLFDDDIFTVRQESLGYVVHDVTLESPFDANNNPKYTQETVANEENSNPGSMNSTQSGEVKTSEGTIDGQTGANTADSKDKSNNTNTPSGGMLGSTIRKLVDRITGNSKYLQLSDDNKYYVDTRTGKKYARVTSVISSDDSVEKFQADNPWGVPSSHIGTSIDTIFRDFFDGKINGPEDIAKYPNISNGKSIDEFYEQLVAFRNNLEMQGLTVIPKDVTVTGRLTVTDSEGKSHTIDVAGTLDLLAYDKDGNFYIFDMKSNRSGIDSKKQEKYNRQLSLYKDFLEKQYGVKVNSMKIIPIGTGRYPDPYHNKYSVKEGTTDQLMCNNREYHGISPVLQDLIDVPYTETRINFNRLGENEKAILDQVSEMISNDDQAVNQTQSEEATDISNGETTATEVTVEETGEPVIDPNTNMNMGNYNPLSIVGMEERKDGGNVFIQDKYKWDNVKAKIGDTLTEEEWNVLTDDERQQILDCSQ